MTLWLLLTWAPFLDIFSFWEWSCDWSISIGEDYHIHIQYNPNPGLFCSSKIKKAGHWKEIYWLVVWLTISPNDAELVNRSKHSRLVKQWDSWFSNLNSDSEFVSTILIYSHKLCVIWIQLESIHLIHLKTPSPRVQLLTIDLSPACYFWDLFSLFLKHS